MQNTAIISEKSERYSEWVEVFGSPKLPIVNTIPRLANVLGELREVYLIDLNRLTADQLSRMKTHICQKFAVSLEELERELPELGVPLLVEDVTVLGDFTA